MALVNVAIPAYNEEANIASTIQSVKQQECEWPLPILVVDNASTDKTAHIAEELGAKVVHEPKKGLCFARQAAYSHTTSTYLIFIDADTRLSKHWAQRVISYLEAHPDVVAVSGNYYFKNAKGFLWFALGFMQLVLAPLMLVIFRALGRPDFLIGTAFAIRREALDAIGGFSPDFPFYGEDVALAMQLKKVGKVHWMPWLFIRTSARRYQKLGIIKTSINYLVTAFFLVSGNRQKAAAFSRKLLEKS